MTSPRLLAMVFGCSAVACGWSEPFGTIYGDCMQGMRAYEDALVRYEGKVMPLGIEKSDYCWQFAQQVARDLERRGLGNR